MVSHIGCPCHDQSMKKLINSLHPNDAIQLTLYINQCILYDYDPIQSCTLHYTIHFTLRKINTSHKSTLFNSFLHLHHKVVEGHLVSLEHTV